MNPNEENESLDKAYTECQDDIKTLKQKIKDYQHEQNAKDPSFLSNYLKTDQAYYPSANKEANGSLNFQCRAIFKGHFNKTYSVSWSRNGYIASTAQDQKLIIWSGSDSNPGKKICVIDLPDLSGIALDFNCKNGEFAACGGLDNQCTIYGINYHDENSQSEEKSNFKNNLKITKLNVLSKHDGFISDCLFMNNETEIVTASGDGTMYLWDIENSIPTQEFIGHKGGVMSVSECTNEYYQQSADNKYILSASTDGTCKLWDYRMKTNCVATYYVHDEDVNCCSFFPDGNAFVSGGSDGNIKLIDIRTHRQLNEYKIKDNKECSVHSVCFSKSGYFLFAGLEVEGNGNGKTWKTATAQLRAPLPHEQRVTKMRLSPDGHRIATSCWDNHVRLWS